MNDIFCDMLNIYVIIYLDDILVYSKNDVDHEKHVRQVLQWLQENKLYIRLSKCTFFTNTIEYLRYIIGPDGIKLNLELVKAIFNFLQLWTLKELQSFLGLTKYYRKFIKNYSRIATPLTDALQKMSVSCPIEFTKWMEYAFKALKQALTSNPCLQLLDPSASEDEATIEAVLI